MQITLNMKDDVALITMDDGKKNAITQEALGDLEDAVGRAEKDAKAIVLTGRPGSFCAGFDINVLRSGDMEAFGKLGDRGGRMLCRLYEYPKPLVAACTGHAFTIGALWLLACDTRIGEIGNFKFAMTESALGRILPAWSLEPLKARINPTQFVPVVTQSKVYDPEGAVTSGFLDELVPAGEAIGKALEIATALAELPADAYAGNKLSTRRKAIEVMKQDLGLIR